MSIEKDVIDIKEATKQAMAEIKAEQLAETEAKESKELDVKEMVKNILAETEVKVEKEVVVTKVAKTDVKVITTNKYFYNGKLKSYKSDELEDAYREGMWFKAIQLHDADAKAWCEDNGISTKALSEGTDTAGGYTVPDQLLNRIIVLASQYGIVRANSDVIQATSDVLWIPKNGSDTTAYFQNTESADKTESDPAFDRVEITIKQLAVLTRLSNQLIADSVINMIDYVVTNMARALAKREDEVCLLGAGTAVDGGITGIIPTCSAAGGSATVLATGSGWGAILLSDFNKMMGQLADYNWTGIDPVWTCSNNFYHQVMNRLKAAAGGNYISTIESGFRKELFGYEVVTSPLLLTNDWDNPSGLDDYCLFGRYDLVAIFANRNTANIRTSREGEAFRKNETHILAEQRFGYKVHDVGADLTSMVLMQS